MAEILDGKGFAKKIQKNLKKQIAELAPKMGRPPGLAVLMVGDNPASAAYVRNKEKSCKRVGIASFGKHFPKDVTQTELEQVIKQLNADDRVDGILVQLPLPDHLDSVGLLLTIAPEKDADGLHPLNLGHLVRSEPGLRSCTPYGVMELLKEYDIPIEGKKAVVVGRSILVGKPIAPDASRCQCHRHHRPFPHQRFSRSYPSSRYFSCRCGSPRIYYRRHD